MLLELHHIEKRYGGVVALSDGNLTVERGEVHVLLGENGAGKSTLMKIIAGIVERDAGQMLWQGREVSLRRPAEAAAIGISMVHQESLLAPHLTVAENLFLGREERLPLGWVRRRRMIEAARRIIDEHQFPLRAEGRVEKLTPAGKQLVEICRAILHGSSLVIFDEPTSSLSGAEAAEVFRIVRALRDRNMAVIYITHRLDELQSVGDRATILRDGRTIHSGPLAELKTEQIIRHMVGREVSTIYQRTPLAPGDEALCVEHVIRKGVLEDISFSLRAGEIVGMAGLMGAGRTELCRALFGVDPIDSGAVRVSGREIQIRSPEQAVKAGIALVTEDRQFTGLALRLPIAHNVTLANVPAVSHLGFLNRRAQNAAALDFIGRLRIRAASPRQLAGRLSGGNQQKVVIAKWLFRQARIFLFDEPTRGIDVGAKIEVFNLMHELARSGAAILMVSSEMPELLQVADRILVMREGRITGELPGRTTQEEIMSYAALETQPVSEERL